MTEPPRRRLVGSEAVRDALRRGESLALAVLRPGARDEATAALADALTAAGVRIREAGEAEFPRLVADDPDARILALAGPPPAVDLDAALAGRDAVWLLAGTAYPGNAGFVVRTAEVSGADAAVIDADFDHAKRRETTRTAMRADRYMPVFFEPALATLERARAAGRRVVAIETEDGPAPWDVDLRGPVLFVLGGERLGIPTPVLARAEVCVRVPMRGFLPSYNLQAAMASVVGERLRQMDAS